jgi:Zn-dependent oligopeptidase
LWCSLLLVLSIPRYSFFGPACPIVMDIAKHYKTGESLPKAMFDKLVAARTFRAGTGMLRQLHFAMTDLALHTTYDPNGPMSIYELEKKVRALPCLALPCLVLSRLVLS